MLWTSTRKPEYCRYSTPDAFEKTLQMKTPKPSSKTLRNHKLSAAERRGFVKRSELPQGALGVDLIEVGILYIH